MLSACNPCSNIYKLMYLFYVFAPVGVYGRGCSTSPVFTARYLVFDSFICSPTIRAAVSRLSRRDCIFSMVLVRRATSSANSVSAICSALTRLLRVGLNINKDVACHAFMIDFQNFWLKSNFF